MKPYIEVFPGRRFWHVVSRNGQISLTSQIYFSGWSAKRSAKRFGSANNLEVKVIQ